MKKIVLLLIGLLFQVNSICAQQSNTSIKEIARKHMVENGELSATADVRSPTNLVLMVYDVINNVDIVDMTYNVPVSDSLQCYVIQTLNPHSYTHIMFSINGNWKIINMRNNLLEIMEQGVTMCKLFGLNNEDTLFVFRRILYHYETNIKQINRDSVELEN